MSYYCQVFCVMKVVLRLTAGVQRSNIGEWVIPVILLALLMIRENLDLL